MAFDSIGLAEPSTITKNVAAVTITRNSTVNYQEIMNLGDVSSSNAIARVLASQPQSTEYGLVARIASGPSSASDLKATVYQSSGADLNVTVAGYVAPSTTIQVSSLAGAVIMRSSAANALVSVYQSTASDLNVTVAGYSTTVNVSSLAGAVIVRSSAANALVSAYQSTAADLRVMPTQGPGNSSGADAWVIKTVDSSNAIVRFGDSANNAVRVNIVADAVGSNIVTDDSSVAGGSTGAALVVSETYGWDGSTKWNRVQASTAAPSAGASGLNTRPVLPSLLSTSVVVASSNSTAVYTLISSAAGVKHKVFAYSLASTAIGPSTIHFMSSNAVGPHWSIAFGSGSSGISGANLAVNPPAFLFQTVTANALSYIIESGSTNQGGRLSISYFSEA